MSAVVKAEKAPKVLDSATQANYASVLLAKENSNQANFEFLAYVASCLNNKTLTQAVIEDSIKAELKGATIQAEFKSAHVKSAVIAQAIVKQIPDVQLSPISKVLTMANRVLDDVKAKGALAHIKQFKTMEELDEHTLTKAESQARDKGESIGKEIVEKASAITLESIIDSVDAYLTQQDLKTLSTTELEKLRKVIGKLITVEKNSKTA
jgi:hypothetical protein